MPLLVNHDHHLHSPFVVTEKMEFGQGILRRHRCFIAARDVGFAESFLQALHMGSVSDRTWGTAPILASSYLESLGLALRLNLSSHVHSGDECWLYRLPKIARRTSPATVFLPTYFRRGHNHESNLFHFILGAIGVCN